MLGCTGDLVGLEFWFCWEFGWVGDFVGLEICLGGSFLLDLAGLGWRFVWGLEFFMVGELVGL